MLSDINVKGTNHKIGGDIADGQWVSKSVKIFSSVSWSDTGTYQYTVQDYLPDDTYTYEVIVSCYATTPTTSGGQCNWWVREADNNSFSQVMGYGITRTNSDTKSGNSGILPLKQENGVLTLEVSVTGAPTGGCGLYLVGYRRLGSPVIPEYYTLTINPTPADATVTFDKGTVSGNSCTVSGGTRVTYTVSKTGYVTETATITVDSNQTINVTLPTLVTFSPSSSLQSFTVPDGVSTIHVDCVASKGGDFASTGGKGGRVQCDLAVTAGETLRIMVGDIPSTNSYDAVYNASDIRKGGTEYANRVIVAGAGGNGQGLRGNAVSGGAGGGLTGADGGKGGNISQPTGGTQTAGGAGGKWTASGSVWRSDGGDGALGLGGFGGNARDYVNGGAGGAGYYGGGGGGAMHWSKGNGGGAGGGGSSYTDSTLCSNVVHTQGYRDGAGYINISYRIGD